MNEFSALIWSVFTVGGSIYLYGWRRWSGWWVVLGILLCLGWANPDLVKIEKESCGKFSILP